jgi:hypothetical protein
MTVLVIGDDVKDQLDKFQRAEYADPENRHFVVVDILEKARSEYRSATHRLLRYADGSLHDPYGEKFWRPVPNGKQQYVPEGYTPVTIPLSETTSLLDWVRSQYGDLVVGEGQEPDIDGMNEAAWIRVNAAGEVVGLFERTIPGGFIDWFEGTENRWTLKTGAVGHVIKPGWDQEPAADGHAGSARKSAIDLDGMRHPIQQAAADWWDCASSARGSKTWESFEVLWERYERDEYSDELHFTALSQWAAQPAVAAIIAASRLNKPHYEQLSEYKIVAGSGHWNVCVPRAIDLLMLPRNEYVDRHGLRILLGYGEVIMDGELKTDIGEGQLFASIPEDALLTLVQVHC